MGGEVAAAVPVALAEIVLRVEGDDGGSQGLVGVRVGASVTVVVGITVCVGV